MDTPKEFQTANCWMKGIYNKMAQIGEQQCSEEKNGNLESEDVSDVNKPNEI